MCLACLDSSTSFFGETAKCTVASTNGALTTTPKACRDGYVNPLTNLCVSSCPASYYGVATYNWRQQVETSTCTAGCPTNCYECIDGTYCKSCNKGFYLLHFSSSVTYGTCELKSGTYTGTLYVKGISGSTIPDQSTITGASSTLAFSQLQDAITKAYELGAPYESATITIYLTASTMSPGGPGGGPPSTTYQAMLRSTYSYYKPTASDANSQSTKLIISGENS